MYEPWYAKQSDERRRAFTHLPQVKMDLRLLQVPRKTENKISPLQLQTVTDITSVSLKESTEISLWGNPC